MTMKKGNLTQSLVLINSGALEHSQLKTTTELLQKMVQLTELSFALSLLMKTLLM
mgnify:CR=1 FL=1